MKKWLDRIRTSFVHFMDRRNGQDELGLAAFAAGTVMYLLGAVFRNVYFMPASAFFFGYGLFRFLSKNTWKRKMENNAFCEIIRRIKKFWVMIRLQWRDRHTYRYFMCRKCGQLIRIPKLKKKIEIKCPKCGNRFVRKG